jgi:hypothetical protein
MREACKAGAVDVPTYCRHVDAEMADSSCATDVEQEEPLGSTVATFGDMNAYQDGGVMFGAKRIGNGASCHKGRR